MFWTNRLDFRDLEQFRGFDRVVAAAWPRARWVNEPDGSEGPAGGNGAGQAAGAQAAGNQGADDDPADGGPAAAEVLAGLQEENHRLKEKIEELSSQQDEARAAAERLEDAAEANEQLRNRYREVALTEAVRQAADNLGIPAEVAAIYSHRFKCTVDADGTVHVEPNPTEFLLAELKNDPLLQQSVSRAKQVRRAAAVTSGAQAVDDADPVELMTVLDRNASRKARFIARHGMQSYVDLAAKARRKGYRG